MMKVLHNDRGSIVGQFALVAIPFVALLLTALEAMVRFSAQEALNIQTAAAVRELSTGGLVTATGASAATMIRDTVCGSTGIAFMTAAECKSALKIGILPLSATATIPPAVVNGTFNASAFTVSVDKNAIMLVRTALTLPEMSALLRSSISQSAPRTLIVSGAIAKLDPYAEYNINGVSIQPVF